MKKTPDGTIDSHQHVFCWGRDDAGLIRNIDEHGIDLHDFLSTLPLEKETIRRIYHANARQLIPDLNLPNTLCQPT